MYTIRMPSGNYLEGIFDLSFELNNQVFSTGSADILPGSFTFPVTVPLTPSNRIELDFPELINRADTSSGGASTNSATKWFPNIGTVKPRDIEGVWVELYNVPMFTGTLRVRSATPKSASVTIILNPVRKLKDLYLTDIDLGADIFMGGNAATWNSEMKDAADTPEDFNFVFFPVYNKDRNGYEFTFDDPDHGSRPYWNNYNTVSEEFDFASGGIVPFAKLQYLLQQIFAAEDTGYAFQNAWQESTELKRIYLFDNTDVRVLNDSGVPSLTDYFNLRNHVPRVKCVDLLKMVIAQWGLGLFTNIFNKSIRLVPLQGLLSRQPQRNWTAYAVGSVLIEEPGTQPVYFNYDQPAPLPITETEADNLQMFQSTSDYEAALPTLAAGYYYIETEMAVVEIAITGGGARYVANSWDYHRGVRIYPDGDRLEHGMACLLHTVGLGDLYNSPVVASRFYETVDALGTTEYVWQQTDPPIALMLYRGMQALDGGNPEPIAGNAVWNPYDVAGVRVEITTGGVAEADAERSLHWFGDYGLYATAHATWSTMRLFGKHIRIQFALPVSELVAFSFEDKVRIGNMDYFVKKLKVGKPLGNYRLEVEAAMVSVI